MYQDKAIQYLANALQGYFRVGDPAPIVNIISTKGGRGKSFLIELLSKYWRSMGIPVQVLQYGNDFNPGSPEFLAVNSIRNFIPNDDNHVPFQIILVEHASLQYYAIPKALLQESSINLTVFSADKIWSDRNKQLFDHLRELSDSTPTLICLNRVDKQVLESFTGMLPPHTLFKKYFYRYMQFGISSSEKV